MLGVALFLCLFVLCCVHSYVQDVRMGRNERAVRTMWAGRQDVEWHFRRQNHGFYDGWEFAAHECLFVVACVCGLLVGGAVGVLL
jgi:hypothetical protein